MSQQLANTAQTMLAAPMAPGDLTLTVQAVLGFPTAGSFHIVIDQELLEVTAVAGTTWTVSRAVEPYGGIQTATSHAANALVTSVVTVQTLLDLIAGAVAECLTVANNLSDLANVVTARANLGLGSAALQASAAFDVAGSAAGVQTNLATETSRAETAEALALAKASNLSDLANVVTARANLGLGSAATQASSAFDVAGSAAGVQTNLTAETSRAETAEALALAKASNLSDLANVTTACTNLGLGSAALQASSAFDIAGAASAALTSAEAFTLAQGFGPGTVTAVAVATANGISGTSSGGATPSLTLALGAITPASVNGNVITTGTGTLTLSTFTLTVTGAASISGTNTGDQVLPTAGTLTGATLAANVLASSLTSVGVLAALTVTATITGSVSGNAGTVTTNANLTGPITSVGNVTSVTAQTGTGTTFVMSASPTFTGIVTAPSVESAEFNNGNSGTGLAIAWNNGNFQKVTVTGVCTFTFTAPTSPGRFQLRIIQDGTGHAITLPTIKYPGGVAPTYSVAANAIDILTIYYDGASYYGIASTGFA